MSFELISNGQRTLQVLAGRGTFEEQLRARAEELLGPDFMQGSFPLVFDEAGLKLVGILGSPSNTRTNRVGRPLFIK